MKMIKEHIIMDSVEMRNAYCSALIEAAENDPRIMTIDCDLANSCGTNPFRKRFPDRAVNVGISEQNACAMAGGLSRAGMIPFLHSFGVFSSRRIYDQIFMSCAYARQNVKIIGCDAGVSAAFNGGTHMAFEDPNILRVMPEVTVVEPSDAVMMQSLVKKIASRDGVVYMRMPRKQVYRIYEDGQDFEIGKAAVIREGSDVSLIACGMEVAQAVMAAELLAKDGIEARVVDMFTMKPIDRECVVACAKETGAIVTAENGYITGGLGSAVCEVVAEEYPVPVARVGVKDIFGEVGPIDYLMKRFELTAEDIAKAAKELIRKK